MRFKYIHNNRTDTDDESDVKDKDCDSKPPILEPSKLDITKSDNVIKSRAHDEVIEPVRKLQVDDENVLRPVCRESVARTTSGSKISGRKSKSNSPSRSGLLILLSILCVVLGVICKQFLN